jgi:NAD(P)H-hydrate epimerase
MKLCTAAEMRALEEAASRAGSPPDVLMENAGLAVAQEVWIGLGAMPERKAVVLVGPGNNGGDGLVAARHLHDFGTEVVVLLMAPRSDDDANLRQVIERKITVRSFGGAQDRQAQDAVSVVDQALEGADAIVDAVLGTGRARPIEGPLAQALDRVNACRAPVYAVDLPTGVDCDTGAADPHALRADVTIALGVSKAGLHTLPGAEYAGRVEVVDIGLPKDAVDALPTELLNPRWVRERLPARPLGGNKGTFGRVLAVAGSERYAGAARLASLGALRAGAGLVTLACTQRVQELVAPGASEVTYLPLADRDGAIAAAAASSVAHALRGYDALLIGPGLGQGREQEAFVRQLLSALGEDAPPVVIDADGLNNLAKVPHWWESASGGRCVLTPHPGEHARLTRKPIDAIQRDRLSSARGAAKEWGQVVVLKGAYTVIAAPDGRVGVSPYANPALASAGTGDVLAGAIAGLLAQGLEPFEAACCGVYLHAAAAEGLRADTGDAGMLAGDLLPELPRTVRELKGLS